MSTPLGLRGHHSQLLEFCCSKAGKSPELGALSSMPEQSSTLILCTNLSNRCRSTDSCTTSAAVKLESSGRNPLSTQAAAEGLRGSNCNLMEGEEGEERSGKYGRPEAEVAEAQDVL